MHYGHPDVFDRVFHITRGGISKASRVINISEDIFAGKVDSLIENMECGWAILVIFPHLINVDAMIFRF